MQGFGPVADAYMPLTRGLNALYGLNGAGKSTLLSAVQTVLREPLVERESRVTFYLAVRPSPSSLRDETALSRLVESLGLAIDGEWHEKVREQLLAEWKDVGASIHTEVSVLADEIARQGLFQLTRHSMPALGWTVAICAHERPGSVVAQEIDAFRSDWRRGQGALDDAQERDPAASVPLDTMRALLAAAPFSEVREGVRSLG